MKKQLFIINPPEVLNPKLDSSMAMMLALLDEGQEVAWTTVSQMFWDISSRSAMAKVFWSSKDSITSTSNCESLLLQAFDGFHMRQEPPVDHLFSYGLWLLQTLDPSKKVFNSARSLLDLNEKLVTFYYPEQCMESIVACDSKVFVDYVNSREEKLFVVKPLDSFGGRGVVKLDKNNEEDMTTLKKSLEGGKVPRMIQPFNPAVKDGELRVFTVMGEDIAWCLKVPQTGSFLANTGNGAVLHDVDPDPALAKIICDVARDLMSRGVYICGFDVLGGKISEINITSPRLLTLNGQKSKDAYQRFAKLILKS